MIYKPRNFKLFEILPKWHYARWKKYGYKAWLCIPAECLFQLQMLRDRYDCKVFINNWHNGGVNQYRGYRPINCKVGARFSPHKWGLAFDMTFESVTADEVRTDILANKNAPWTKYIHAIEFGIPWLHWDMRNVGSPDGPRRIQIIDPLKQ